MARLFSFLLLGSVLFTFQLLADDGKPVSVSTVAVDSAPRQQWFNAEIISTQQAQISTLISGKVEQVVSFGEKVKQGKLLVRLEDTEQKLQLSLQQAMLEQMQLEHQYRKKELLRLESQRNQGVAENLIDEADYYFRLSQAAIKEQQVKIRQAQYEVDKTRVLAPFSGIVSSVEVEAGERVQNGQELLTLINPGALSVRVFVPIKQSRLLKRGEKFRLRNEQERGLARLTANAMTADEQSRQVEIRLVPEQLQGLLVGEATQVLLPVEKSNQRISIPRDALVFDEQGKGVFIVDENLKVARIEVNVLGSDTDRLWVSGDLKNGDRIVVKGAGSLASEDQVKLIEE